ncbi:MAG: iron ABC transporter permease, partial [Alphaproteobacteria bacterium]
MNLLLKPVSIPFPFWRIKAPAALLLLLILVAALLIAGTTGAVPIPLGDLLTGGLSAQQEGVFFAIRLPRICLAILVGGGLAVSGAAMQGLFRNPLADPGLIGIAMSAALAVAIVIVLLGSMSGAL